MQDPSLAERLAAVLGGAACIVLALLVWRNVGAQQHMWPFPALYLIEVMVLGAAVAAAFLRGMVDRGRIGWIAGGALLAFSILGAWTIGLAYLPASLLIFLAGVMADVRQKANMLAHFGLGAAAAVLQAVFMIAMAILN